MKFSLRGVQGAQNDAVAMGNLDVARKMEDEGKDSKAIWLDTGWERGKDGKWRNEIPDAKATDIDPRDAKTLGELIDAPELFESYPEFKGYKVEIKPLKGAYASFNSKERRVSIDPDLCIDSEISPDKKEEFDDKSMRIWVNRPRSWWEKIKALEREMGKNRFNMDGLKTIVHEIQHAIQD